MKHALAALLLLATPAMADEKCAFVDADGWRAEFNETQTAMLIADPFGASELVCRLTNMEPNTGASGYASCSNGTIAPVQFSGESDASYDVMQFRGRTFRLTCWDERA